ILGAGADQFIWNPGDASDLVEGGTGTDTLQFNGSNISESLAIFATGARTMVTRDIAAVTMDLDGVEHIQFKLSGGNGRLSVGDPTGTSVTQVAIDLSIGGVGDSAADAVTVNGTAGNDHIAVGINGLSVIVQGLAAQVVIAGAEPALDTLLVNGLDGNDS